MQKNQEYLNEEMKQRAEHQAALSDVRGILATKEGKGFMKYLFKSFDVGELPAIGLKGEILHEHLGIARAGNSIFKIAAEANPEVTGLLLAQVEKEKYEQKILEYSQQGT